MAIKVLVVSNFRDTIAVRPEAEMFIGLQKMGLEVEIMTFGDAPYVKKFEEAGISVIDFHPEKKLSLREIRRIKNQLIAGRHDIIHLCNGKAIRNGIQAAKKLPVKIVLYRGYAGNIHWYDPTAYLKYLHPRVDKIYCVTEATREHVQQQFFFHKDRAVAIHKGHHLDWYKNVQALPRSNLPQIPADGFWIINVANNRPMKGIPWLIKAMDKIDESLPIHLLLVGKDMDDEINLDLIHRNRNKNKIHILGYRKDVLQLVKTCNAFVLSSIKGEAITKAVIEAMSMGIPPIITDIPGNRDLVIDQQNGLVVPIRNANAIADAILKLFHHPRLCQTIGSAARQQIRENFNIEDTILNMKKLYEALLQVEEY